MVEECQMLRDDQSKLRGHPSRSVELGVMLFRPGTQQMKVITSHCWSLDSVRSRHRVQRRHKLAPGNWPPVNGGERRHIQLHALHLVVQAAHRR